jgi:DNA-binding LytR/AlgR family response regulator
MKYKCLIVDDEPLAQDVLENYVQKMPSLQMAGKCGNAVEALQRLRKGDISIIFLDIQMPEISGLDFLKSLKNPPAVIFTTAYSDYAIDAFDLDAVDYLLKPIPFDRFLKAVNKAISLLSHENSAREISSLKTEGDNDYIFVKADKKLVKIGLDEILYIEGLKDYVMIYTPAGRTITLQTMKNLEEKLPSDKFIRVHRSFIISIGKVKSVTGSSVEVNGKSLPIGKLYRDQFMKVVEKDSIIR